MDSDDGENDDSDESDYAGEEKKIDIGDYDMDVAYFNNSSQSQDSFTSRGTIREARCTTLNTTDSHGRTALHVASSVGDARLVSVLTKFGASREVSERSELKRGE